MTTLDDYADVFYPGRGHRRRSSNPEIDLSRRRSLAIIERNRAAAGRRKSVTHQAFLFSEAKHEIREMHR